MHPGNQANWVGVIRSWLAQYRNHGSQNNPTGGSVIADTGAVAEGWYDVYFSVSASAALGFNDLSLQWRNDNNDTTLWEEYFQSAGAYRFSGRIENVYTDLNERFRVITGDGITGDVSASIIAVQRNDVKTMVY